MLTAVYSSLDLDNKCITYYIDNNNAISTFAKADNKRIAIGVLASLLRGLVAKRGITPRFGRVDSKKILRTCRPDTLICLIQ